MEEALNMEKAEDSRIWPFEPNTAYFIWRNAIAKVDLPNVSSVIIALKGSPFTPTFLRKFFRTRIATVIPVDVVEAMMAT